MVGSARTIAEGVVVEVEPPRAPPRVERAARAQQRRVAVVVEVVRVRARAAVVEEHRALDAPLHELEVALVWLAADLDARRPALARRADRARRVRGGVLDSGEDRHAGNQVWPERQEEVREPRHADALVGLEAPLHPEAVEVLAAGPGD